MSTIRLVLADDHRLFRQGLRQICETVGGFEVVGEAENGQEAVDLVYELEPDVILMDINMPVLDGVQATTLITESGLATQVVILTMHQQDRYVFEAVKAGARGYLLKDADGEELVAAVRAVCDGEALIDPMLATKLLDEFRRLSQGPSKQGDLDKLTEAEMEVLQFVAQGEDNKTIAKHLDISEKTVANRLLEIYQKLQVRNRTQAALVALRRGWVPLLPEQ
jgi:DNA-binding NarL/FixJ family response regulator